MDEMMIKHILFSGNKNSFFVIKIDLLEEKNNSKR